jgi:hypothetical protein
MTREAENLLTACKRFDILNPHLSSEWNGKKNHLISAVLRWIRFETTYHKFVKYLEELGDKKRSS